MLSAAGFAAVLGVDTDRSMSYQMFTLLLAALLASVPVGDTPFGLDVDPITNLTFVTSTALNNVTVIDGKSNTVAATVPGIEANFVSVNFVTEKVYLAGNNGVTVMTEK